MKKDIRFMAILLAFVMQSMAIWSSTLNGSPVYLHYKKDPKIIGTNRPSRAPANKSISLNVFHDDGSQQLTLTDSSNGVYSYFIYNEEEETISQGTLSFGNNDSLYIDLWGFQSGTYVLEIICGGCTYSGTFEIN